VFHLRWGVVSAARPSTAPGMGSTAGARGGQAQRVTGRVMAAGVWAGALAFGLEDLS